MRIESKPITKTVEANLSKGNGLTKTSPTAIRKGSFKDIIEVYRDKNGNFTFDAEENRGVIELNGHIFLFTKDEETGVSFVSMDGKFVTGIEKKDGNTWAVRTTKPGNKTGKGKEIDILAVEDEKATKSNNKVLEELEKLTNIEKAEEDCKKYVYNKGVYDSILNRAKESVDKKETRIEELKKEINAFPEQAKKNKNSLKACETKISTQEEELAKLEEELKEIQTAKATAEKEQKKSDRNAKKQEKAAKAEANKNEKKAQVENTTEKKASVDYDAQIAEKNGKIEAVKKEIAKENEAKNELIKKTKELNKNNEQNKAESARLTKDLGDEKQGLKADLAEIEREYAEKVDKIRPTDKYSKSYLEYFESDEKEDKEKAEIFFEVLKENQMRSIDRATKNLENSSDFGLIYNAALKVFAQPKHKTLYNTINGYTPIYYTRDIMTEDGVGCLVISKKLTNKKQEVDGFSKDRELYATYYVPGKTSAELEKTLPEKPQDFIDMGGKVVKYVHSNEKYTRGHLEVFKSSKTTEENGFKGFEKSKTEKIKLVITTKDEKNENFVMTSDYLKKVRKETQETLEGHTDKNLWKIDKVRAILKVKLTAKKVLIPVVVIATALGVGTGGYFLVTEVFMPMATQTANQQKNDAEKNANKAKEDADKAIKQAKEDADKAISDANKAKEDANKAQENADKDKEEAEKQIKQAKQAKIPVMLNDAYEWGKTQAGTKTFSLSNEGIHEGDKVTITDEFLSVKTYQQVWTDPETGEPIARDADKNEELYKQMTIKGAAYQYGYNTAELLAKRGNLLLTIDSYGKEESYFEILFGKSEEWLEEYQAYADEIEKGYDAVVELEKAKDSTEGNAVVRVSALNPTDPTTIAAANNALYQANAIKDDVIDYVYTSGKVAFAVDKEAEKIFKFEWDNAATTTDALNNELTAENYKGSFTCATELEAYKGYEKYKNYYVADTYTRNNNEYTYKIIKVASEKDKLTFTEYDGNVVTNKQEYVMPSTQEMKAIAVAEDITEAKYNYKVYQVKASNKSGATTYTVSLPEAQASAATSRNEKAIR